MFPRGVASIGATGSGLAVSQSANATLPTDSFHWSRRPSYGPVWGIMAHYLITGIAGFIGSSLAHALIEQGHTVRGLDNLSTGRMENLEDIRDSIFFVKADIRDRQTLVAACSGVEYVLHQAALASVPLSIEDPIATHDTNVNGTLNVLWAAREAGVRRIVYAASSSAYGNHPALAKHEDLTPQPLSPYAVQKLTGEYYIQAFSKAYGMEAVCLRYFNIFGPKQDAASSYSGVIAQFIRKIMAGETPTIYGDGSTSRDFTFVADAVQANLLACTAHGDCATGRVFNVGTGRSYTLNLLYETLADILGYRYRARYGPERQGDVRHSLADIERIRTELGYLPQATLRTGLEKTVSWYMAAANKSGVRAIA